MAAFQYQIVAHTYTVGHVMLFIYLVLETATSCKRSQGDSPVELQSSSLLFLADAPHIL